jgi:hypothetical protein
MTLGAAHQWPQPFVTGECVAGPLALEERVSAPRRKGLTAEQGLGAIIGKSRRRLEGYQVTAIGRFPLGAAATAFSVALFAVGTSFAGDFEQPPSFSAAQVLPRNLLHSRYYRLDERVGLDNSQYVFRVHTNWGSLIVKGSDLLRVRAREMAATAELERVSGPETVMTSAVSTALKPVETAINLVTKPVRTIGDTVRGVGHIFGTANAAMNADDPHKEGIIASVTGASAARRKLAFALGVDPNTSFPPLSKQLTRLATASAFGETGANVGLSFIGGPAGIAIGATGASKSLREALRDKTAAELERDGRLALARIGVSRAIIEAFYVNAILTPTDKAIIVGALERLHRARGCSILVAAAAKASTIKMGYFYRQQAKLIVAYAKHIAPVQRFVRLGGTPMLQTSEGTVSLLPVDYLIWTPQLADVATGANRSRGGKGGGEIWITGKASPMATAKLAQLGWTVVPNAAQRVN